LKASTASKHTKHPE